MQRERLKGIDVSILPDAQAEVTEEAGSQDEAAKSN